VGEHEINVSLDRPVLVLLGPNGSGKSTVLQAVEWALFGATAVGSEGEEIKGTALETHRVYIHRGAEKACVTLRFEADGHRLEWRRVRRRATPKPGDDSVTANLDDESIAPNAVVLLGLTPGLFRRVVCPGQGALRALVSNEKSERNAALDRLFGMERLNILSSGLGKSRKVLNKRRDDVTQRLDRLVGDVGREVARRFDLRSAARQSALDAGILREGLTVNGAVARAKDLARELDHEITVAGDDLVALRRATEELRKAADDNWKGAGSGEREMRLRQAESIAIAQRSGWQKALSKRLDEEKALSDLIAGVGDEQALKGLLELALAGRANSEAALSAANARVGVLTRAAEWLAAQESGASEELGCPVCERPLVRGELERLVNEALSAFEGSDGRIAALRAATVEATRRYKNVDEQLASLATQRERTEKHLETERHAFSELVLSLCAMGKTIPSEVDHVEAPVAALVVEALQIVGEDGSGAECAEPLNGVLGRLAGAVEAALKASADEIAKASATASNLRARALALLALGDFLGEAAHLDRLDDEVSNDSLTQARAAVNSIGSRLETLAIVGEIAAAVSASEAQQRVSGIAPRLNTWFERLSNHDALKGATLRVDSIKDAGSIRNAYQIRACSGDGWEAGPGPILSGGYQTTLAVAALCSLADDEESRTGLGLLALDEPTQSLDPELTKRMGKALGAHVRVPRLIVTTTEESFAKAIAGGAGASRIRVLRLADWTAAQGTRIEALP
jgi:DNA repair exonuclease SbcCD ATPase subunit